MFAENFSVGEFFDYQVYKQLRWSDKIGILAQYQQHCSNDFGLDADQ